MPRRLRLRAHVSTDWILREFNDLAERPAPSQRGAQPFGVTVGCSDLPTACLEIGQLSVRRATHYSAGAYPLQPRANWRLLWL